MLIRATNLYANRRRDLCPPGTFKEKVYAKNISGWTIGDTCKSIVHKAFIQMDKEDFRNIRGLSYETAVWLLGIPGTVKGMEKEITMEEQVFYLLKNLELIKECGSFWELKEKLIMRDISWEY